MVRVLPIGADVDLGPAEALMAAARRQGLWWPTVCDGHGECGTCWVVVEAGGEHCSPLSPAERERLDGGIKAKDSRARLACQLRVSGPVTVSRRSVRWAELTTTQGGAP